MTDILREIGMISRALDSIANIEFKPYDLTKGQFLYLVRVCEQPGIIQERLGELIKVDRSTVIRAVQKLQRNGLVEKRPDQENKKIRRLYPTEKGRQLYPLLKREDDFSNQRALQGFSTTERHRLAVMLQRMATNVNDDWHSVKKGHQRDY
ncbi:MarR family winged helix-turn-helix transcriptional regulator [Secundilactobacillus collinoides]|uniref:Protease synthase and sporulation negative regulatory PAI 1 domain protein n=2 Tax=Secundilactobacillus collinoides TaxID=33960 RepID=A0A0R2BP70_SECCO|nr:MarR family transcriptional regulator [Secundilactobacillus collinoides]KRM78041.1 protease synthase and sporulation negative regulatory PAI 1 domain protein [Secundilactobacillus collinoides DSM 20515 = JCM 1123]KZL38327.1 MarR family transcriptional regulator [Secundilactobacillus collinoides]